MSYPKTSAALIGVFLCITGCKIQSRDEQTTVPDSEQVAFSLKYLTPERATELLDRLHLGEVTIAEEPNCIALSGPANSQHKTEVILTLVDNENDYVVESLGSATKVRTLPSNRQISQVVGDVALGTFSEPAPTDHPVRGLLDVHGDEILLIVPASYSTKVRRVIAVGQALENKPEPVREKETEHFENAAKDRVTDVTPTTSLNNPSEFADEPNQPILEPPKVAVTIDHRGLDVFDNNSLPQRDPNTIRGVLRPFNEPNENSLVASTITPLKLPNGDDVLDLTLPEKMELIELLDLAGEYLDMDYIYDSTKIQNQAVTLRLHGKRKGELHVRDLYTLLETALKFKGLVMTRKEGNLVSIAPVGEALDMDPTIVATEQGKIQAGDMIVTRVFQLEHVDVASVTKLLESMKLSVALSSIAESQKLFVTCYAHRMERIENLVRMVDRSGDAKEFRFRELLYTTARATAGKIQTLASKLQDINVSISTAPGTISAPRSRSAQAEAKSQMPTVFLDTDDRTNRLLMIGGSASLDLVEQLIDTLDIPLQDTRIMRIYAIKRIKAGEVEQKLQSLGILGGKQAARARSVKGPTKNTSSPNEKLEEPAQVTLIEATNSLLINASLEQHQRIQDILGYIDVARIDRRLLKIYSIEHIEADEVVEKLQGLDIIAGDTRISGGNKKGPTSSNTTVSGNEDFLQEPPKLVVLENTNSLLVNATTQQHEQILRIIDYVDTAIPQEAIPYEIYFLENQSPDHLSEVLSKIINETIIDKEGKVAAKVPRDADDKIVIVPDNLTFSLIVYANRKNQDWIRAMIDQLDRQQSQVLIDVTLVEVSKSDQFNYDWSFAI